ncbi:mucin-2-like [Biomphalaria glabrata]|uniref:Mucin-2-like n=1 Tax=Biomphalaria glabrata TaxID=6526 RepID=A0A9U8E4Q5_BIOGL|nr:mucin-2-like [Biomphalaria glabrata]
MTIRKTSKLLCLAFVFIIISVSLYAIMNIHSNYHDINSSSFQRDTFPIHQTSDPQNVESGTAKNVRSLSNTNHQSSSPTFKTEPSDQASKNVSNAEPNHQTKKHTPDKKTTIFSNTTSSHNASLTNSNETSEPNMLESISYTTPYQPTSSTIPNAKSNPMTPEVSPITTSDQHKSAISSDTTSLDNTHVSYSKTTSNQQTSDNMTNQTSQAETLTTIQQQSTTITSTVEDITNKNYKSQNNIIHEDPSGQDDKTNITSIFVGLVVGISLIVSLAYVCFRVQKRKQTMRGSTYVPLINYEDDTDQVDGL